MQGYSPSRAGAPSSHRRRYSARCIEALSDEILQRKGSPPPKTTVLAIQNLDYVACAERVDRHLQSDSTTRKQQPPRAAAFPFASNAVQGATGALRRNISRALSE
jgi:hypothetical protein